MKQASEVVEIATKAISANFPLRNVCSVRGSRGQHQRITAYRRRQLREWISVLRTARIKSNSEAIERATDAGPLPAHALRRRVLLAA